MSIVTPDIAKEHLRYIYDAEAATIQLYIDAAERECANFLNRELYPDAASMTAAKDGAQQTLNDALAALKTRQDGLPNITDTGVACAVSAAIDRDRVDAFATYRRVMAGIVMDETIMRAVLLKVGDAFANREDVLTGDRAAAVALPSGSVALLMPYRIELGV